MHVTAFLKRLGGGLSALGPRRLAALGFIGLTVFVLVGVAGYYFSRPQREVLYANLDAQDVTRIGAALDDAGIVFDITAAGDAVLVDYGETARARMILARKGLPKSDSAGYELFDKIGSLGLTSFMQQITQVRALEGELARTIQLIDGVRAARVHLALRNDGFLHDNKEKASASVVIRTEGGDMEATTQSIRHLVAAAIPGLTPDQVTVMSTDGTLLAGAEDATAAAPEKMIGLERSIAADLQEKLNRTLAPYLGLANFRVSVTTKLNTDKRQMSETNYDPNSRVERSVRTIKETGESQNSANTPPVGAQQNVPQEATPAPNGDNSREKKDHKEELTNYEINSKQIATTSEGYAVDKISVAIVLNRSQLEKTLGANPPPDAIKSALSTIEEVATSATGLNRARGDTIKVTAVEFIDQDQALQPTEGVSVVERLWQLAGTFINAGSLIIASLLILLLGIRPALRQILALPAPGAAGAPAGIAAADAAQQLMGMTAIPGNGDGAHALGVAPARNMPALESDPQLDELARQMSNSPRARLAKIVELDPSRAAQVLKQWLEAGERTAA